MKTERLHPHNGFRRFVLTLLRVGAWAGRERGECVVGVADCLLVSHGGVSAAQIARKLHEGAAPVQWALQLLDSAGFAALDKDGVTWRLAWGGKK